MPPRADESELRTRPVGIVCNPRSGGVRRRQARFRAALDALGEVEIREVADPDEITVAVRELTAAGCGVLALVGGDGTVQAALTALADQTPVSEWPLLAVVPAGSTNMSAKDFGTRDSPLRAIAALEEWHAGSDEAGSVIHRPAVRVAGSDGVVRCGMFFGAGGVSAGVSFFRDRLYQKGIPETQTSSMTVAWVLAKLAWGGGRGEDFTPRIRCEVDGELISDARTTFCLVSTLDRLILGTRPHWGGGDAPLRFTLARRDAKRFWTGLPRLALGRPGRALTPERGFFSSRAHTVSLTFDGRYVVDGELYDARAADGPLRITALAGIRWLVV